MSLPISIYRFFLERRRRENLQKRGEAVVPCPILSVGNITVGGTGKTPTVQWLARFLQLQGWRVGVACRGYKGSQSETGAVVTPDSRASEVGDEALLHARSLAGAVVTVARNREKAAVLCHENGAEVVILDDGFQYWSLPRCFDLVLLDAQKPWGPNGKMLPLGRLREEPQSLARASAIVFTRSQNADKTQLKAQVRAFSQAPVFFSVHAPLDLKNERTGEILSLEWLKNREVEAIAGLADNAQFFESLEKLGAKIQVKCEGKDHQVWKRQRRRHHETLAVTTEKDAVKLSPEVFEGSLLSLRIGLQIEGETELQNLILAKLKGTL